jgi:hypothetical protein
MPWWRKVPHRAERPNPQFGLCRVGSPIPGDSGLTEMIPVNATAALSSQRYFAGGKVKFADFDWSLFVTTRSDLIFEMELTYDAGIEREAKTVFLFTSNRCLGLWGQNHPSKPGPITAIYWLTADGILTLELRPLAVILRANSEK